MRILALYIKEIDYKKVGKKRVEVRKVNFTDKRVVKTLRSLGYSVDMVEHDKENLASLKNKYDLVFNLADGLENDNDFQEISILKEIERLGIPYTGNSSEAVKACCDKANIKRTLIRHRINTPGFQVFRNNKQGLKAGLRFPLILKPLLTDGGIGISDSSVVRSEKEFKRQLRICLKEHGLPVLAEEYIDGRDFCVPVLGGIALPPVECTFGNSAFMGRPKIMTYSVKWDTKSPDYKYSYFRVRSSINKKFSRNLADAIKKSAELAFNVMGCSAYATVDMRVNEKGEVFVIEVNPNCWIDKYSDSAKSAKSIGVSYKEFIDRIVRLGKK